MGVTPNTLRMEPVVLLLLSLLFSTTGQGAAAQSKPGLDKLSLLLGGIFSICDSDGEEGLSFQELKICKKEKTEELKHLVPTCSSGQTRKDSRRQTSTRTGSSH